VLAGRPTWQFSSGPLGTATTDAQGHEVSETAGTQATARVARDARRARTSRVFRRLKPHPFDLRDRLIYAVPAGKKLLIEGDFRDWDEVDAWAKEIAHALQPVPV